MRYICARHAACACSCSYYGNLPNPIVNIADGACRRSLSPQWLGYDSLMMDATLRRQTCKDGDTKDAQWANANWHSKATNQACQQVSPTKGTGVFLPCLYDEPEPKLRRSSSDVSAASKDDASSGSGLSRLDSCQSSKTDCSFIASHGPSFPRKLPAGMLIA